MGYTHYWNGNKSRIDLEEWPKAIADCEKIIAARKDRLRLDVDDDKECIVFNGNDAAEEAHETFFIPRSGKAMQGSPFDFCKTARKPYDVVVVACLARLAEAGLWVSSDGSEDEWQTGLVLARNVLARDLRYPVAD